MKALLPWLAGWLFACCWTVVATAHEIRPMIADIEISSGQVNLQLRFNGEMFLAGIDAAGITDTDAAPEAERYDSLRQLPAGSVSKQLQDAWPQLAPLIFLKSRNPQGTQEQKLVLELQQVTTENETDPTLPRDSLLQIRASLPTSDGQITAAIDGRLGPVIMREMRPQNVDTNATQNLYTAYLQPGEVSQPISPLTINKRHWLQTAANYVIIGFDHILPKGADHILFVLGLFFYAPRIRPLLWQVTAFTLAHSFTLALATLKIISVPPVIIEVLIAASIIYIAVENIAFNPTRRHNSKARENTRPGQLRLLVITLFGLLHGLGFASVLAEIGLPADQFILSLLAFNIGVEIGQLTVLLAAALCFGWWATSNRYYDRLIAIPASVLVGLVGVYWLLERLGLATFLTTS